MAAGYEMILNDRMIGQRSRTMTEKKFKIKDPGSAVTHFIGMLLAGIFAVPLLIKAAQMPGNTHILSMTIFIMSMVLLYGASTAYHTFDVSPKVNKVLKKIDHMMIFILIAGTYTPICMVALRGTVGYGLLALVWGIAAAGIIVKACWIYCPKWFSSILYISMGWVCVFAFAQIVRALPTGAFCWLLAGGIIYTIGGVIYALKLPLFNSRHKNFGSHEIFHLFVMAGSACHFIVMYVWLADMPI